MAQVTHILTPQQRIDPYLDYLFREWGSVPELAQEWWRWEELDRLDFMYEWAIRESYRGQLEEWATQGLLSPAQHARYKGLLKLIARYRPTLEELFES